MFAAFIEPSESPVPTMLCTSSMTRMMLPIRFTSSIRPLHAALNWPRNCVPATRAVRSSRWTSLLRILNGMRPLVDADCQTLGNGRLADTGSPIRHGLFFWRRFKI